MILSRGSKTAAVGAAVAAVLGLGASPSSAAPNWQPWVQPADYECGPTTTHKASANIAMQTCIIRSGDAYQSVAVVVNNASTTVYLAASVHNTHGVDASCVKTAVPAKTRVACYGATKTDTRDNHYGYSWVYLNNGLEDITDQAWYYSG